MEKILNRKTKKIKNEVIYWKRSNGDLIDVNDMTKEHLINALKILLRKVGKGSIKI